MKTFLIHHTHILYKYMQQLLEPSIADYLKKQKEEKMDKLAEVAVTEDDCKVCTVLKQNVEAEYLNSCIDFWNDFKEANGEVKGSENGWAAAVEYHIKKVAGQVITQAQISKKYEMSCFDVETGRFSRSICRGVIIKCAFCFNRCRRGRRTFTKWKIWEDNL